MGWDGGGNVTLLYDWGTDRDTGSPDHFIQADKFDAYGADLASAIEATLNRNGENAIAANINWGGYKITTLGNPTAAQDAVNARKVADNALAYGGTTGGSSNAYTCTHTYLAAVATGTRLLLLANHTNTGAATLNVNGAGAVAIVQRDGATALTGGEIVSGDFFEVAYDGTSFVLISAIDLSQINQVTISNAGAGLVVTNTTDSAAAQVAQFHGDRATMADGDTAFLSFYLSDDAGTQTEMVRLNWQASDVSDTTEDGYAFLSFNIAGTVTDKVGFDSAAVFPVTNDGMSLGKAAQSFSDLFLASGGVININNGAWVATHSGSTLNISTGSLTIAGASLITGNNSASGDRWDVNAWVASDGVMEVGQYIDFHESDGNTGDYNGRIWSSSNVLYDGVDNTPLLTGGKHTLWLPAAAFTNAAQSAALVTLTGGGVVPCTVHNPSSTDWFYTCIGMPKSWNEGTISMQVYWAQNAAGAGSTVWRMEAGCWGDSDNVTNAYDPVAVVDAGGTVGDLFISAETSPLTISSTTPTENDMLRITFGRLATDASDTLAVDAYLIGIKLFITINAKNDA